MSESPTPRDAGGTTATPEPPPGSVAGVNLLLVIIYGAMFVILFVLFVKRLVQRIAPKFSKGYADVSKHAPKAMKEDINRRLMQTLHVVYEPQLLAQDDDRIMDDSSFEKYNYIYRMKAVDDVKQLEEALCRTDESLKRPPLKDLKQHLRDVKSHSSGVMKNVRSSQLKALTDLYEHARYKQENFGRMEYEKFVEALKEVKSGIEHKSKKKRVKKQSSQRNTNHSHSDTTITTDKEHEFSEVEPLLEDASKTKQ